MEEDEVLEPITFYGATKACATLLVQQFAKQNQKPISILRPFSVYGYFESPQRLIPKAIQATINGISLKMTPNGFARDFIFVQDVVDAILLAEKIRPTEIINIGTGTQTTNEEVISLIEGLIGKKTPLLPNAYPPHLSDTSTWVANRMKAKEILNWEPPHTLKEGLLKTIAWTLKDSKYDI